MNELAENLEKLRRKVYARAEHQLILRKQAGASIPDEASERRAIGLPQASEPLVMERPDAETRQWSRTSAQDASPLPTIAPIQPGVAAFAREPVAVEAVPLGIPASARREWDQPASSADQEQIPSARMLRAHSDLTASVVAEGADSHLPAVAPQGMIRRILAVFGWR